MTLASNSASYIQHITIEAALGCWPPEQLSPLNTSHSQPSFGRNTINLEQTPSHCSLLVENSPKIASLPV